MVVTVICVEPDPVTEAGLNAAVAPVGNPLTLNVVAEAYPLSAVTLTEYVVLPPDAIDCVAGVAARLKSAAAVTTSVALAVWLRLPLVAVMVSE